MTGLTVVTTSHALRQHARHELLHALGLGVRVIRAVALQQIDHASHAKASAERDNEGLQSVDCR